MTTRITNDWAPSCSQNSLVARAEMLAAIRQFFQKRQVIEVDTPSLSSGTVTDVYLEALTSQSQHHTHTLYLQTSPEFAMKRLLVSGSGCIYQICHAFREDEQGRNHNLEFSMLEWYRIGFDHHQLMDEMDALLIEVLGSEQSEQISYQQLFLKILNIDPLTASGDELQQLVFDKANGPKLDERDEKLHCLFAVLIEPKLGKTRPLMVYDFPASQSALARISKVDARVADRFEVYYQGIELANGFHELSNADEQRKRFEQDNLLRRSLGKPEKPLDERFLSAIEAGLPDCAGVALGLDRLLMLKLKKRSLNQVMAFPIDRA